MASRKKPQAPALTIAGEFNIFSATSVREQLLAALSGEGNVEVDLSRVSDFDTAGVQLMLAAKRQAEMSGKKLTFTGHSAPVVEILDLLDLVARFGDPVLIHSRN